ncbi:MarR family transcriptional regulator, partial [Nocardia gipuzkoensis]
YAQRNPHPHDARARLITLTERGWAATRAADAAIARFTAQWDEKLGTTTLSDVREALARVVRPGRVRPSSW